MQLSIWRGKMYNATEVALKTFAAQRDTVFMMKRARTLFENSIENMKLRLKWNAKDDTRNAT